MTRYLTWSWKITRLKTALLYHLQETHFRCKGMHRLKIIALGKIHQVNNQMKTMTSIRQSDLKQEVLLEIKRDILKELTQTTEGLLISMCQKQI